MKKVSRILKIVTAVATVLLFGFLAWSCIDVYRIGSSANPNHSGVHIAPVFTREIAASRLAYVRPWLFGYMVLLFTTALIRAKAGKINCELPLGAENRLRLVKKRIAQLPEMAQREERLRRNILIVTAVAVLLCILPGVLYLTRGENFSSWELESVMGQLALHVLPCVAVAYALMIAAVFLLEGSMEREITILKTVETKPNEKSEKPEKTKEKCTLRLRFALCVAALLLIVLGVINGGARDVLIKAVNICTECIGLG